jgi:hypothetical protein
MVMVRNPAKERLAAGQLAIGVAVLHARSVHQSLPNLSWLDIAIR